MKRATDLDYTIHHLCIYDKDPRNHMWPYLKWHHGITGYFWGDTYHITQEGHADYTFLGCGGRAFQIQLEAPPYQFEYERRWYAKHGNGYNHICWIVNDAAASYEQLQAAGATIMQEYQPFPTYNGFVMADPEGRWIEIMEYTHPSFRVQEFSNRPAGPCGLKMIGFLSIVNDVDAMTRWYGDALGHQTLFAERNDSAALACLADGRFDASDRNTIMMLATPRSQGERTTLERTGPYIGAIVYQAIDVEQAFEDGIAAGMTALEQPSRDPLMHAVTARLREPSGNEILLRDALVP
jgi:catechol 2,3-dioxygenase-like lactoylglutathione lyase family enzyme